MVRARQEGPQLMRKSFGRNTDHRDYGALLRHTLLLLSLALTLPVRGAQAQARIGPTAVQLRAAADLRAISEAAQAETLPQTGYAEAPARDYRWEGLAIGAGVVGVAGALLLHSTCEADEACTGPTVAGFALGAVVGGVTGGLVGSSIPKGKP